MAFFMSTCIASAQAGRPAASNASSAPQRLSSSPHDMETTRTSSALRCSALRRCSSGAAPASGHVGRGGINAVPERAGSRVWADWGGVRSCPFDASPSCVSTSATTMVYMPAWEAPQGSPADAMSEFEAALAEVAPSLQLVEEASVEGREYRRFQVEDKLFNHDDVEVLISAQRPPYEADPLLVTFRSMAAEVKYVWPIQQAITDFGVQQQRLKDMRAHLGWCILGCDLVECYEE